MKYFIRKYNSTQYRIRCIFPANRVTWFASRLTLLGEPEPAASVRFRRHSKGYGETTWGRDDVKHRSGVCAIAVESVLSPYKFNSLSWIIASAQNQRRLPFGFVAFSLPHDVRIAWPFHRRMVRHVEARSRSLYVCQTIQEVALIGYWFFVRLSSGCSFDPGVITRFPSWSGEPAVLEFVDRLVAVRENMQCRRRNKSSSIFSLRQSSPNRVLGLRQIVVTL